MMDTLLIALVGLPARGKSTMGRKIARTFELDDLDVRVFNNGELRRTLSDENTSSPDFFSPANEAGLAFRDHCALINLQRAREFLNSSGKVAIIDATNVTKKRRKLIEEMFFDMPLLFIECVNTDEEALEANLERKGLLKEFCHLSVQEAVDGLTRRIGYYEKAYEPLDEERNRILVDSFEACILQEQIT
ncbi:MAG: 6-phosphofructo-2-kinase domain-containing protein, partial [Desulfobulbales bacterium]